MRLISHAHNPCFRKLAGILIGVTLVLALMMQAQWTHAQQNLPDMGEPADTALSPSQERQLGADFMRRIRGSVPLVRDIQINEYLTNLGTRLASSARNRGTTQFTFFIIDDATINAFAIPGGYIGVNAGLITAMTREDQFAGVVAHELAHLTQRHHARAFVTAGRNRLSTAAAILAAIVIGASNTEAGQAALAAGLAISQQTALNYTRSHEYEADRIGIKILSDAAYDPVAIAETFEIMRRKNRINNSATQIEYLRTHPLDNNRIAEARSRAATLPKKERLTSDLDFKIFQARLNILSSKEDNRLRRLYAAQQKRKKNGAAESYALALLETRARNFDKADKYLGDLLKKHPGNVYLNLLSAEIEFGKGQVDESTAIHEQLLSVYPTRYSIVEQFSKQLANKDNPRQAEKTIRRYLQTAVNPEPRAWRDLAALQESIGKTTASHESIARFYIAMTEYKRAQVQINLALKSVEKGSQDEMRIESLKRANEKRIPAR